MKSWSSSVNNKVVLKDFAVELTVDYKLSNTSWNSDYEHYCRKLGIVPCPSFNILPLEDGKLSVRLANRIIDLHSWRAMLLASSVNGSMVSEIAIQNVQLTSLHLTDLCLAIEKLGRLEVLKLDHLSVISTSEANVGLTVSGVSAAKKRSSGANNNSLSAHFTVFAPLFACNASIDYISLQGNMFSDEFITVILPVLANNLTLQSLNLTENLITDAGATRLFSLLKLHHSLRNISLRKNLCEGSCIEPLITLITGMIATTEEEHGVKNMIKLISDRNKMSKDSNKKRKKLGQMELEEVHAFSDHRLQKMEKGHGPHVISNRLIGIFDFSYNPLITSKVIDVMSNSEKLMSESHLSLVPCDVNFVFQNVFNEADVDRIIEISVPDGLRYIFD
mmetsp:Transcript_3965/g.4048  ORF Transcript_3965/g.4048 Transcript_3965/m.4048 type:complete len:391 (-) Transcript_3965:91-1263(-)